MIGISPSKDSTLEMPGGGVQARSAASSATIGIHRHGATSTAAFARAGLPNNSPAV
jgi:hypothetical protein